MALVVEDATGLLNAESYVSVAEADTYFTNRGITAWTGDDAAKEAALRYATEYIDRIYIWKGRFKTDGQALGFPRINVTDHYGRNRNDEVPTEVKRATFELAVLGLTQSLLSMSADKPQVKKEKVGDLEIEYQDASSVAKKYESVDELVYGLYSYKVGTSSGMVIRG